MESGAWSLSHWTTREVPCSLYFKKYLFIYTLYLTVLGFHCCLVFFSSCSEQGLLSSRSAQVFHCGGFSYCWSQALGREGFSSCGSGAREYRLNSCGEWTLLLCSTRDLPGPEIEPVFTALAGGFFTMEPPGKPPCSLLISNVNPSFPDQLCCSLANFIPHKDRNTCSVQSPEHRGCIILGGCGRREKAAELDQRTQFKFSRPSINIYWVSAGGMLLCRMLPRLSRFFSP